MRSERTDVAEIAGVGCGVAGAATVTLPAGASAITVRRPKVGETADESRLTGVLVAGTSVQLTAVGDGATVCDPEEDPDVPPAQRPWQDMYGYDIAFRERVNVTPVG